MTNTENNPSNGSRERAVVYVRVSSKKQAEEGVSIAAQTEKGKAYATIMEFAVSDEDVFVDDGSLRRSTCGTDQRGRSSKATSTLRASDTSSQ